MIIYTATGHIVGGRDGRATAGGGSPDLALVPPPEMGGPQGGEGTNPEELFALGYGACFLSTLQFIARKRKMSAKAYTLDSSVALNQLDDGFELVVTLDVAMPDVNADLAVELLEETHGTCVYSKAIANNVEVTLLANGEPVVSASV